MHKNIKRVMQATLIALLFQAPTALAEHHQDDGKVVRLLATLYQKPGVNLRAYDKVYVDRLGVADAKLVPPPWVDASDKKLKDWQLADEDIQFLRDAYRAAMKEAISGNDGYPVVNETGEGVLILDINVVSLTPYAARGEKVVTKGTGELVVQVQIRDGATGELLGIYQGKQPVGDQYQENTRLSAENNLKGLFDIWGNQTRKIMDEARND